MIMVPTTAGSGSEVSQWTIVKDEVRHLKLLGGGPLSFPDAAILDPVTLRSLPMHVAALPAVDTEPWGRGLSERHRFADHGRSRAGLGSAAVCLATRVDQLGR